MISAWWLILIVPMSASIGCLAAAILKMGKDE